MLLRRFLPIFLMSLTFFAFVVQLVDLFSNLVRFLNLEVPLESILSVQVLFIPKAIMFALPIALLFAVSFSLGNLYSNNELISVFGSGISLLRFVRTLIFLGLVISIGSFFFNERVVIPTYAQKNEETRRLLNITRSFSNSKVTVRSADGRYIYSADYFNDDRKQLSRVLVLQRDTDGRFVARTDADQAEWAADHWILVNGYEYTLSEDDSIVRRNFTREDRPELTTSPRNFQRVATNIDELPAEEARIWIDDLRASGQAYRKALTDYYSRFSFALTPFIVIFLSSAIGGRFRRNILLMSLLSSLASAVIYYVTGMILGIIASDGLIPPLLGAWTGVLLFTILGVILFSRARN